MKTHLQKYGLTLLTASAALGLASYATAQPFVWRWLVVTGWLRRRRREKSA